MEIYITCLIQILSFSSHFRQFKMKTFLCRPTMVAKNTPSLVAPRNFANFTGKHMCRSYFFNKVVGAKTFIKNRLQHRRFPVKFANFLRAPFFAECLQWLLLKIMNSSNYLRVFPIVAKNSFNGSSTRAN